jgi:hypothetical protein
MRSLLSRKFLTVAAGMACIVFAELDQNQIVAVGGLVAAYLGANVTQKKVDSV